MIRLERPLSFECRGATLVGVLHGVDGSPERGLVIVVGGPQYRVGSHRQFVSLARALAAENVPVLRFDYRGMGDSDGDFAGFEHVDADIRAAVDALERETGVTRIVLWGLCDAASAILFYAHGDPRVAGIALVNPWVRTEAGIARAYLKHYYRGRLASPEFWKKVARGEFRPARALRSLMGLARSARGGPGGESGETPAAGSGALPERMAEGLASYRGPVQLTLSGDDLTAAEFEDAARASARWHRLLAAPRITRQRIAEADHTFSRAEWWRQVVRWTVTWVTTT